MKHLTLCDMSPLQTQKVDNGKGSLFEKLRHLVQDAYTALADNRSHNAEQAFKNALALLETCTLKVIILLLI